MVGVCRCCCWRPIVVTVVVSWREELGRREMSARERVEQLRGQIAELTGQLAAAEQQLSRLMITRETMTEIEAEPEEPQSPELVASTETVVLQPVSSGGSPIGVMLVPQRVPGADAAVVLPEDYTEIMVVFGEADGGLRAGQVAAELGIDRMDRSKVESLRSKLKRLVARGWLDQQPSGVFTLPE